MNSSTNVKPQLSSLFHLRKRVNRNNMGPQTEENESEIIEMVENAQQPEDDKNDDWNNSEESECEVMLKTVPNPHVKDFSKENEEGFWLITFQVFFPFLIAGLGMVGAGLVLDIVQASILY